jgi:hypothetical protein
LAKTHRALFQGIDEQGRPLISDQFQHLPRQAVGPENIRVCLLLRRYKFIGYSSYR